MQKTDEIKINDPVIAKMFEAGAHFGYKKSRRHPSVASYIYTTKNQTDIIDLDKTKDMLKEAKAFAESLGKENKVLLFVGTKPESREIIKTEAMSLDMPYVTERWIGGTLSNWTEIKKKITELENYRKESKDGGLAKYTKKEKMLLNKRMDKLERFYGGVMNLKKLPDAIFIVDAKNDDIAKEEARKTHIPVIALMNSDSDIKGVNYPIVGNDSALPSIKFFTKEIADAYKEGLKLAPRKEN